MHGKSSVTLKNLSISSLVTTTNKHMAKRIQLKRDEFMTNDDIQRLNEQYGNYGSAKIMMLSQLYTTNSFLFSFLKSKNPFLKIKGSLSMEAGIQFFNTFVHRFSEINLISEYQGS